MKSVVIPWLALIWGCFGPALAQEAGKASREEILSVARTFREKQLPCDSLIYLGTGFCPSGWNTGHGSFTFNSSVFPDPRRMIEELHALSFRIVLHVVIQARELRGTVHDRFDMEKFEEKEAASYWNQHRKVFALGVDGWWPDDGDELPIEARFIGRTVQTTDTEIIEVKFQEIDGMEKVLMVEKVAGEAA